MDNFEALIDKAIALLGKPATVSMPGVPSQIVYVTGVHISDGHRVFVQAQFVSGAESMVDIDFVTP